MARSRKGRIGESTELLVQLEHQYRGRPQARRIRMLRLLKQDSGRSLKQVADELQCSERTTLRWWNTYQKFGLSVLIRPKKRTNPALQGIDEEQLRKLKAKLRTGAFSSLKEIQQWLRLQFNISYSLTTVSKLLNERLNARQIWVIGDEKDVLPTSSASAPSQPPLKNTIPDRMVDFLNHLPVTGDIRQWIEEFRNGLATILGEVDRISVNINNGCNLSGAESKIESINIIRHYTEQEPDGRGAKGEKIVSERLEGSRGEQLVKEMTSQGFPLTQYHKPITTDYYFHQNNYLGTIILWRKKTNAPISKEVSALMLRLEPFIVFLLSDGVARLQRAEPVANEFQKMFRAVSNEAGLTAREREVMILHLLGKPYEEIAEKLFISVDTVRKHVKAIHRKTGSRSYTELFGTYFGPFQPPHQDI